MAQDQDVFKRYEKKYRISGTQYQEILERLSDKMVRDEYGLHTINNIYYDTDNFALIRASIEKPVYKEKLRLRSYGTPKDGDKVFVELKKKFKGVVYKRRIALPLMDANRYLIQGRKPEVNSQIFQEIDWFVNRYQPQPKVFIGYDRLALIGSEDSALRVTFDQNIRYRTTSLDLAKGTFGAPLISPGEFLMELKIPGVMPLWLSHALNDLKIYPTSFSKIGACYKDYLLPEFNQKGGILSA